MSAQLVLTDLEMETILESLQSIARQTYPPLRFTPEQTEAALRVVGKLAPHLERPSRRGRRWTPRRP